MHRAQGWDPSSLLLPTVNPGRQRLTGAIAEELDLDDFLCTLLPPEDGRSAGSSGTGRQLPGQDDGAGVPRHHWSRGCRCGGEYLVEEGELSEQAVAVVVPCSHCSLAVRVAYCLA